MKKWMSLLCLALVVGALAVALPAGAQTNYITNGDFEGGFTNQGTSGPLDGVADNVPNSWTRYETFSGGLAEGSWLGPGANGISAPGLSSLMAGRQESPTQNFSGDWTAVYQDLNIKASRCSALTLNLDTMVIVHNLWAGGWVAPAFEWPVIVQITYTTTGGATQVWRHGWYLDPPGDVGGGSPANDPGTGLIPFFNDTLVPQGAWVPNTFDLLVELPQVDTIDRIYVGGSGWDFEGQVDNVGILCMKKPGPMVPAVSFWGALGLSVLVVGLIAWRLRTNKAHSDA